MACFVFDYSSSPQATPDLHTLVAEREVIIRRVLAVLGDSVLEEAVVDFHASASAELKGLVTQNGRWAHLDWDTQTLHVVIDGEFRGDHLGLEASLLFQRALGLPTLSVLDTSVATFFSTQWGNRGFEYWAARLHSAELIPSLSTILSPGWIEGESPFIVHPVAGVLVAHLLSQWSRTGFVDRYASWQPKAREIQEMEMGWSNFLDGVLRRNEVTIEADLTKNREQRLTGFAPVRGVNISHEGYRTYDAYLSERSSESLARLSELGAHCCGTPIHLHVGPR